MPSPVPAVLIPYIQEILSSSSQSVLTSVLDASTNWLVLRLLVSALYGVDDDRRDAGTAYTRTSSNNRMKIVFLSFTQSFGLWSEMGKKVGVDFRSNILSKQLAYIDGLASGITSLPTNADHSIKLKSHTLPEISNSISAAKQSLASAGDSDAEYVLIVGGIDFVLASQPDLSCLQLTNFINSFHGMFSRVILTLSADSSLLHNIEASATPLELNHSSLVRQAVHQSSWVMQLRPLETGHARDVSGVIRVCHGGSYGDIDADLPDGEWLYQVKGDGGVKVWGRGE